MDITDILIFLSVPLTLGRFFTPLILSLTHTSSSFSVSVSFFFSVACKCVLQVSRHAGDLRERLERAEARCLDLGPKGRDHDDAVERCAKAEAELVSLRAQVERATVSVTDAAASERAARGKCGDLEHQVSYLGMDKQYLQKEVDKANRRADKSEQAAEHCTVRLREVESLREGLMLELSRARETGQSEYEQRLAMEMERQRESTTKELGSIRESLKAVHQRECDVLREARGE